MSAGALQGELRAFYEFLGTRIGNPAATPEDSVREFRAYQEELLRARDVLRESHAEYLAGQARPLDVEALLDRVQARTAEGAAS